MSDSLDNLEKLASPDRSHLVRMTEALEWMNAATGESILQFRTAAALSGGDTLLQRQRFRHALVDLAAQLVETSDEVSRFYSRVRDAIAELD